MAELELIVVVARKIWFHRNGVVNRGEFTPPQQLFCEANMSIDDFRRVTTADLATRSAIHTASPLIWQTPPTCMYKINLVAAVDKKNGRIRLGIVVQDYEEMILVARSTTKEFLVELVVTETLATFHARELCREIGFPNIILKRDVLQIINAVKTTDSNWNKFGHIIEEIKYKLSQLRSWSIEHIKRIAHITVHTIAQKVILCVINRISVEEILNYIYGIIFRELLCPT